MSNATDTAAEQMINLDPVELRRLVGAMREGCKAAVPEVTNEVERGFILGWQAAFKALDKIADAIPEATA